MENFEEVDITTPEFEDDSVDLNYQDEQENEEQTETQEEVEKEESEENEESQYSSFSDFLQNTFGWENVPADVSPEETVIKIIESYDNEISKLEKALEDTKKQMMFSSNDELIKLENTFHSFNKMTPKELVYDFYKNEYDGVLSDEEIEKQINNLENRDELDIEYKKILATIKKDYTKTKEELIRTIETEKELEYKREQAEYQMAISELSNEISSFDSEYFELTSKDKEFAKLAFTHKGEDGETIFEKMINNPKTAIEMFFATIKLDEMEKTIKNKEKKIKTNILNSMSSEPVFNSKIKGTNKFDITGYEAEDF